MTYATRTQSHFRYGLSVAFILTGIGFGASATAQEEATEESVVEIAENATEKSEDFFSVQLKELRSATGHIELRQSHSYDSVFYSIAPQMHVNKAELKLEFVNSVSLMEKRSQLRILNNGSVVGQFRLDPAHPNGVASVDIPGKLIEPGYNQLSFEVSQHYTEECEDFSAPELWTQINTELSELILDGEFDLTNPKLSQLDELISPNLGAAREFVLMSASPMMSDDVLSWGGMISQAVALRLDYFMPNLHLERAELAPPVLNEDGEATDLHSGSFSALRTGHLEDENLILFGTKDEIRPFVSANISNAITSSFVGIYPLKGHDGKFALVISGTTPVEVGRAALAFSLDTFPFVDDASMLISDVDIPLAATMALNPNVEPDTSYKFSELEFQTQTLSAIGEQSAVLQFKLPADFYVRESENFELALDMSYGAGFRGDSVLNLHLNGQFIQAISLSSETGATFRDYHVYLPARAFIPGRNTIEFRPAFYSPYGGECISPGRDNLLLTLSGGSELDVPNAERYVRQPDLSVFERTGFPYTGSPTGSDLAILVAGKDDATISSAYLMVAKLAQVAQGSLYDMAFSFKMNADMKSRNVLVVGAVDGIDKSALTNAPLSLTGDMSLPYPISKDMMSQVQQADFWQDFNSAYEAARGKLEEDGPAPVVVKQTGKLGDNSVVVAYQSPYHEDKTMTVMTAATPSSLEENVSAVVQPELWGQLAGDLALWRAGTDKVWVQRAGSYFHVGTINFFELMRYHLARAPWWWIFGFVVIIPVFAWTIRSLLKERRRLKETI